MLIKSNRLDQSDSGGILPMILVMTVVFTMIITAVATLVTTGLRYGRAVEDRADLLAASDGGLRYGIERLRNFEDLCTTKAGTGGGYTTIFPPKINGADTEVTCRRVVGDISDLQGWGLVITGEGVNGGHPHLSVNGSSASPSTDGKILRGPVYVADAERIDINAELIIQDGDLWHTEVDCSLPIVIDQLGTKFTFDPNFLRGPSCVNETWTQLFDPPTRASPTPQALVVPAAIDDVSFPGCRVFAPGKYTTAPAMTGDNYFRSGDYYFQNIQFDVVSKTATFGFPSGSGDDQKVSMSPACTNAMNYDQNTSGERGGATIWMGGSTNVYVGTQGKLEVFRRQQFETYMSFNAIRSNGAGFIASSRLFTPTTGSGWILETKSGNNNDMAIHGLFWAPRSEVVLGNITNTAVGQLVGGLVVAYLDVQASASANSFALGVEGNPIEGNFLVESIATKDGLSTTIRAIVQYRPVGRELAVNSWRVVE